MTQALRRQAILKAINNQHLRNEANAMATTIVDAESINGGTQSKVHLKHNRSLYADPMAIASASKRALVPVRDRTVIVNRVDFAELMGGIYENILVINVGLGVTIPTGSDVANSLAALGYPDFPPTITPTASPSSFLVTPSPKSIYFTNKPAILELSLDVSEFGGLNLPNVSYQNNRFSGPPLPTLVDDGSSVVSGPTMVIQTLLASKVVLLDFPPDIANTTSNIITFSALPYSAAGVPIDANYGQIKLPVYYYQGYVYISLAHQPALEIFPVISAQNLTGKSLVLDFRSGTDVRVQVFSGPEGSGDPEDYYLIQQAFDPVYMQILSTREGDNTGADIEVAIGSYTLPLITEDQA